MAKEMKMIDLNKAKEVAVKAAKDAGKIAMKTFRSIKNYDFKDKGNNQIVCETDLAAESLIKKRIAESFPDHAILAEESGNDRKDSEYMWIIDPLDGTRNYIHGHPSFGVSIALARNREVILGVTYFPVYDWLFTAEKGKGAEMNSRKIHVSDKGLNDDLLCNFGCNFYREKDEQIRILSRYIDLVKKIRIEGSAVFGFCLVADGTYDSYTQRFIKPWDCAAACFIVEEAGGKVTDYEGNPWNLSMDKVIASNGKIHDELLKVVKNG